MTKDDDIKEPPVAGATVTLKGKPRLVRLAGQLWRITKASWRGHLQVEITPVEVGSDLTPGSSRN